MTISLLCLVLLTFISLIFIGKKIKRSKWNLPPSPPTFPVIGNLHQIGELPHRSLQRLAERTGHVMLLYFGFIPITIISSKEAAEEVLKTHDLDCCSRPNLFGPRLISRGFKDIGFTPYNEEWKARRRFLKEHKDIVDLMLDVMHKQGKDDSLKHSIDHIKGFLTNILIAGIDTGAITLIWAMTELARNPKLMKKIQGEIRDRLGNNKERITEDDIEKVPYLNLVIKETFRLHPAVPLLLPRETMAHIKVQGYDIPPKRRILVNAWAIGRDPKLWEDPEVFNPERFIDSHVDYKGQHFELLPFGSGRRICLGMAIGMVTVELGLLNLLYFFDWKLPDGMTHYDIDIGEAGALTTIKKIPLKLVPVRVQ